MVQKPTVMWESQISSKIESVMHGELEQEIYILRKLKVFDIFRCGPTIPLAQNQFCDQPGKASA